MKYFNPHVSKMLRGVHHAWCTIVSRALHVTYVVYTTYRNEIIEKLGDVWYIHNLWQWSKLPRAGVRACFYPFLPLLWRLYTGHLRRVASVEFSRASSRKLERECSFILISHRTLKKKIIACFSLNINNSFKKSFTFEVQVERVYKCYYKLINR